MYSDSHCHLRSVNEEIIKKAEVAGVKLALTAGIDVPSSKEAVRTSNEYESVKSCVGIHPWRADTYNDDSLDRLRVLAMNSDVLGISEIGLDYVGRRTREWVFTEKIVDKKIQRIAVKKQIDLAKDIKLPVLVHDRTPNQEVLDILEGNDISDVGAAIHGFNKDLKYAKRCMELGVYVSIGRRSLEAGNKDFMKTVKKIPLDWMLTETDSSDPAAVILVAEKIAELKSMSKAEVGQATTRNLKNLLGL